LEIEVIEGICSCCHLFLNGVIVLLVQLGVDEWTFRAVDVLDEGLINRRFQLRLLGGAIEVTLDGFDVVVGRFLPAGLFDVRGVDILLVVVAAVFISRVAAGLKGDVVIFRDVRNGICFCVELSLACLGIGLGLLLLVISKETLVFARAEFMWNVDLRV
jgi:hypothetical protein